MNKKFSIKLAAPNKKDKLPISFMVVKYFEAFILENILLEKKIIVNSKWNTQIVFYLMILAKSEYVPNRIHISKPTTIRADNLKLYNTILPIDDIIASEKQLEKIIFFDALTFFFITNYKIINAQFMNGVWKKIDMDYLLKIPYPAPLKEIKHIGD